MSDVSGLYEVTATTPMGNQTMTLSIEADGNRFTGRSSGQMGASEIDGTIDGDTIKWKQPITVPMPLTLECSATISGDSISGAIDTGSFGSFPIIGKRVG
ncbi:hypothetical protein M9978_17650 [Sphingomonas sp. MG17]|uniref:Uncharacterized protein n=1 Tax=Sphingomonas tagetis TaxID=2949092 RepID=A0A9X2HJW9_9SPHN|nr:hypothetical protein [Sphingomonas tagetis]MCP3732248.1 hypothetical protein [Sphingomonas tagetis]